MTNALFIYTFMLFGSTFLVYWGERCRYSGQKNFLYFVAFLVILVPTAIRFDVGTDYHAYIDIYENIDQFSNMEKGFYYINKFLAFIEAPSQFSIAIFAFIFLIFTFISAPPQKKYIYLYIVLSLLMLASFNGVRQVITIAISLWAIKLYLQKKTIMALFVIILGALFHKSILLLLPIYVAALIPLKYPIKAIIAPTIMVILVVIAHFKVSLLISILEHISAYFNLEYSIYFGHSRHFVSTSLASGLGVLAKIIFSLYVICTTRYLIKLNSRYWLLTLLTFSYTISIVLAKEIEIFGRLEQVFVIAPIYAAYIFIVANAKITIPKTAAICFILFITLSFYKIIIDGENDYTNPKLYPYQTIFSQELSQ